MPTPTPTRGGRSTDGCWTCRLRHKKCDQRRPGCRSCTSRHIPCHGYAERPDWFDGGARERACRDEIKRAVKNHVKRVKRELSRPTAPATAPTLDSPPTDEDEDGHRRERERERGRRPGAENAVARDVGMTITTATSSGSPGSPGLRHRDAELLMYYFDRVFPLQFRFHTPASDLGGGGDGGLGWLLGLLVRTGPLYHAALSLSALHQYTLRPDDRGDDRYAELHRYHTTALRDLQLFLRQSERDGGLDDRSRHIEVLACGVSLISFEVRSGVGRPVACVLRVLSSTALPDSCSEAV